MFRVLDYASEDLGPLVIHLVVPKALFFCFYVCLRYLQCCFDSNTCGGLKIEEISAYPLVSYPVVLVLV